MSGTSGASDPADDPAAAAGAPVPPRRAGGVALLLGAVLLVVEIVLDDAVVIERAYEGPAALLTVVSNPLWLPWRVVFTGGRLALAVGIAYLLVVLYGREETTVVAGAGAALALGAGLYVLEFVVAALAAPSLFTRPRGTGLSGEQVRLLLVGYQSLGIGLLAVASWAFGTALVLVGLALSRTGPYRPALAGGGVVVGVLLILNGVGRLVALPLGGAVGLFLSGLVVLWFLALGTSVLRTPLAD